MSIPAAEDLIQPTRFYKVIDLARLLNVPCHTIEACLDPDPRGAEILRAVQLGKLDWGRITNSSLAQFQTFNP